MFAIKFEYKGQPTTFRIPIQWSEIFLIDYIGFLDRYLPPPDESNVKRVFKWHLDVLSHFAEISPEYQMNFPFEDAEACFAILSNCIFNPPPNKPIKEFEHDGIEYTCPDSDFIMGKEVPMSKMSAGQWLDAQSIAENLDFAKNDIKGMPFLLATLYLPKGEKYDSNTVSERAKKFETLNMETVWGCYFFLLARLNTSNSISQDYLLNHITKPEQTGTGPNNTASS